jgi:hypothetical protein
MRPVVRRVGSVGWVKAGRPMDPSTRVIYIYMFVCVCVGRRYSSPRVMDP